jgi:hypothetical protein
LNNESAVGWTVSAPALAVAGAWPACGMSGVTGGSSRTTIRRSRVSEIVRPSPTTTRLARMIEPDAARDGTVTRISSADTNVSVARARPNDGSTFANVTWNGGVWTTPTQRSPFVSRSRFAPNTEIVSPGRAAMAEKEEMVGVVPTGVTRHRAHRRAQ